MKNIIWTLPLAFILLSGSIAPADKEKRKLVKRLLKSFKTENVELFRSCLASEKDVKYFLSKMGDSTKLAEYKKLQMTTQASPTMQEVNYTLDSLFAKIYQRFDEIANKRFLKTLESIQKSNVNIGKCKILSILHKEDKRFKESSGTFDIEVILIFGGKKHLLELDDCFDSKKNGFKIGDPNHQIWIGEIARLSIQNSKNKRQN